jgi:phenylpropionate dioxygenase-like ring-hydroxylating dioxygenase large terminal subunit
VQASGQQAGVGGHARDETCGNARQFVCKYHGWRYGLDGACTYVHQEDQFFDLRKDELGLAPVHCGPGPDSSS